MKTKRKDQITELITREISILLPKHVRSETYKLLYITHVELNSDSSQVKVWISAQENIELLQKELNFRVRDIQMEFNKMVHMKVVPKLVLKADEKNPQLERVENLLNKL